MKPQPPESMEPPEPTEPGGLGPHERSRGWHVVAAVAVGVAAAGFLAGIAAPPERTRPLEEDVISQGAPVPRYSELGETRRGPNASLYERGTSVLAADRDLYAKLTRTKEDRADALRVRDERRAYDGAPPTIPHAIDQRGFPDCLSCHGAEVQIEGKIAPTMSHRRYDSCTQCHVVDRDPRHR